MSKPVKETHWGHPIAVWECARQQMRAELVARARSRSTVSYSELCEAVSVARFRPYSWAFMALLDEVCRDEDARTGVVLATLVVRKDTGRPGEGYFSWAEREGARFEDRESFWSDQAEAVWAAYGPTGAQTSG